jgi:hypothetical protein
MEFDITATSPRLALAPCEINSNLDELGIQSENKYGEP